MASQVRVIRITADASDLRKAAKEANLYLGSIEKSARKTRVSMNRIMGMGAIMFYSTAARRVANFGVELALSAEKIDLLSKRMITLTKDSDALDKIVNASNRVGVAFDELATVVGRFAVATKNSFNTDEMIAWTEGIIKSGRLVGNTQKEITSGLTQLSQSLSAGALMGDEYRSVMENLPLLAIEIRKGFEGDTRSLKELSSQGVLTTEVVVGAMGRLNDSMEGIPGLTDTVSAKLARMGNAWDKMLSAMMGSTNNWVAHTIDGVTKVFNAFTKTSSQDAFLFGDELDAARVKAELLEAKITYLAGRTGRKTGLGALKASLEELRELDPFYVQQKTIELVSSRAKEASVSVGRMGRAAKQASDEAKDMLIAVNKAISAGSRPSAQDEIKKEKALDAQYIKNQKLLLLSGKLAAEASKRTRITEKWIEKRRPLLESLNDEITSSEALVLANKSLEDSYAAEAAELAKLLPVKEAIKEVGECDAIKQEISCIDALINKYNPLAEAISNRNIAMNEQSWLLANNAISEEDYARALGLIEKEYIGATTEADNFTVATQRVTEEADVLEVTWNRVIRRLDNGFVDMWKSFVRGSIDAMDFVKEIAYDFLAEMLHAFTTKKLVLSLGATISSVGAASAASAASTAGGLGGIADIASIGKTLWDGFSSGMSSSFIGTTASTGAFMASGAGMSQAAMLAAQTAEFGAAGTMMTTSALGGSSLVSGLAVAAPYIAAAVAALAIFGGGMFDGNGDTTPDLNLQYRTGLSSNGNTGFSFSDNDAYFDVGGKFAGAYLSTQHDAFGSESQALEFKNSIQSRMDALDGLIVSVLGEGISDEVVAEMDKVVSGEMKFEEFGSEAGGAIEAMFQDIYSKVFESITRVTGDDSYIKIFESYSGSLNEAIAAATSFMAIIGDKQYVDFFLSLSGSLEDVLSMTYLYSTATDELKTAMDGVIKREGDQVAVLKGYLINLEAVNTTFKRLGVTLYEVSLTGMDWANTLVEITGGIETFNSKMSFFFDNFYTAGEKAELIINDFDALSAQFENLHGMALPRTVAEFKNLTLALLESGPPMYDAVNAMLELSPALLAFVDAENTLLQAEMDAAQERTDAAQEITDAAQEITDANNILIEQNLLLAESTAAAAYAIENDLITAFDSIGESVDSMIESWTLDTFTDEQKYNYYSGRSDSGLAALSAATSITEIEALTEKLLGYGDVMFSLLDDEGKSDNLSGFVSAANSIESVSSTQLSLVGEQESEKFNNLAAAAENSVESANIIKMAADSIKLASEVMQRASDISLQAANTDKNINITMEAVSEVNA